MSKYDIVPNTYLLGLGTLRAGSSLLNGGTSSVHEKVWWQRAFSSCMCCACVVFLNTCSMQHSYVIASMINCGTCITVYSNETPDLKRRGMDEDGFFLGVCKLALF